MFNYSSLIINVEPDALEHMTKGEPIDGAVIIRGDLYKTEFFLLIDNQKRLIENFRK